MEQLNVEVERIETDLDSTRGQLAQSRDNEMRLDSDLLAAREEIAQLNRQLYAAQKEAEHERKKNDDLISAVEEQQKVFLFI
jgi:predicted  nucleic acid-binding Zn-ribbon protein